MSEDDDERREPIQIPYTELSADALQRVIESFVLREGTDYGPAEFSLEQKVTHVLGQLERGEAEIVFDPDSESVNIVSASPNASSSRRPEGRPT